MAKGPRSASRASVRLHRGAKWGILLVGGPLLTRLMIRFDIGGRVEDEVYIKLLNEDFFD